MTLPCMLCEIYHQEKSRKSIFIFYLHKIVLASFTIPGLRPVKRLGDRIAIVQRRERGVGRIPTLTLIFLSSYNGIYSEPSVLERFCAPYSSEFKSLKLLFFFNFQNSILVLGGTRLWRGRHRRYVVWKFSLKIKVGQNPWTPSRYPFDRYIP